MLGTDMKQHFSIIAHFNTLHRQGTSPRASELGGRKRSSSRNGLLCVEDDLPGPLLPLDEVQRLLALQMLLKCSDLGHVGAALPVHLTWVGALEEVRGLVFESLGSHELDCRA